jgi:hypothetical protein
VRKELEGGAGVLLEGVAHDRIGQRGRRQRRDLVGDLALVGWVASLLLLGAR